MKPFSYIAKTQFYLPQHVVDRLLNLDPIDFSPKTTQARNPIYRQLNAMVIQNQKIEQSIELSDPMLGETLTVTPVLLEKLKQRYQTLQKEWNIPYTAFREQELPTELQEKIKSFLPRELKELDPHVVVQSKFETNGIIAPHRDHYRSACLFYLLQGNQEKTVWWEKNDDFEEYSFFRFADVTKIVQAHTEVLQEGSWYVFDNLAWHSVHPTGPIGRRTAVCIEFKNISAAQLYQIISNHEY
jgi:hypothetical protein